MNIPDAIKANVEQIGRSFEEFKAEHAKNSKERDGLIEEKLKNMSEKISALHETTVNLKDKWVADNARPRGGDDPETSKAARENAELFWKMRTDVQRFDGAPATDQLEVVSRYEKAFWRYARVGEMMEPDARKDMSSGSDPDGGYFLLPPTMARTIVQRVFETSPLRMVASVETIGTRDFKQPEDPTEVNAGWVGETQSRSTTAAVNPAMRTITAFEMYAQPAVSQQTLEDSFINLETYLSAKIADKFARLEATAFVQGTGVEQPRGFMTYAAGTTWGSQIEQVNSGSSGAFTYSGLINLITSLKDKYHAGASWMIKRGSIASIMLLTDGASRLIFQPILNGNFNETPLLGYPIHYANDIAAVAANALAAAFGDWRMGYQIVDRVGISTIRDNLTAKPNVLFYTRRRVGGDVIDFDAIKIQKLV